jgi:hypothetical protein
MGVRAQARLERFPAARIITEDNMAIEWSVLSSDSD